METSSTLAKIYPVITHTQQLSNSQSIISLWFLIFMWTLQTNNYFLTRHLLHMNCLKNASDEIHFALKIKENRIKFLNKSILVYPL